MEAEDYLKKDFVTPEMALTLKELGFNEDTIVSNNPSNNLSTNLSTILGGGTFISIDKHSSYLRTPLIQKAFRWFRVQHKLFGYVVPDENEFGWKIYRKNNKNEGWRSYNCKTYEEAETECLKQLISLVKLKQND